MTYSDGLPPSEDLRQAPRKVRPDQEHQDRRDRQVAKVRGLQEESSRELEAMMPSILDNSLKGSTLTNQ